jgi:hypothetical protein
MNRQSLSKILLVLFGLVILGIIGGYFYLSNTKTTIQVDRRGTGGGLAGTGNLSEEDSNVDTSDNSFLGEVPRLRKISATPVAGATIFNRRNAEGNLETIIRHVDRATGNIYETSTSSLAMRRVTNTTIPKVNEAYFSADGNTVILRYSTDSDLIQTFIGKVSEPSTDLVGTFAADNINFLSLSPLKNRFFYLTSGRDGARGFTSDFLNKAAEVFKHPLKGWLSSWPNESALVLTTKPSSRTQGASYLYNLTGRSLAKIIGPKNGLIVLPAPDLGNMLFSETRNNTLLSGFVDVKTGSETGVSSSLIPDKCVWSSSSKFLYCGIPKFVPTGEYPDVWYQGIVLFSDNIATVDLTTLNTTNLINPEIAVNEEIDAIDLQLSPDEQYLIFTNKKDLSLWGLRLY